MDKWTSDRDRTLDDMKKLQADNSALQARIEELEKALLHMQENGCVVKDETGHLCLIVIQRDALQAKLDKAVDVLEATGCGIESVLLANRLKRGDQKFLCGCLADVNTALKELKGE
jgi:hypothetical protein